MVSSETANPLSPPRSTLPNALASTAARTSAASPPSMAASPSSLSFQSLRITRLPRTPSMVWSTVSFSLPISRVWKDGRMVELTRLLDRPPELRHLRPRLQALLRIDRSGKSHFHASKCHIQRLTFLCSDAGPGLVLPTGRITAPSRGCLEGKLFLSRQESRSTVFIPNDPHKAKLRHV